MAYKKNKILLFLHKKIMNLLENSSLCEEERTMIKEQQLRTYDRLVNF